MRNQKIISRFSIKKSFFILSLLIGTVAYGQDNKPAEKAAPPPPSDDSKVKPTIINLNEKGDRFIRFIGWAQIWGTYTQTNTGTTDLNGKALDNSIDFGIRRARMLVLAKPNPRFTVLLHFGINNQSFNSGGVSGTDGKKPQIFFHDVWGEYSVIPNNKLSIGAGLLYWNGISRMANASTLNFMTMDAPIHNWVNIETTDQFARQLGIYAKGQLGNFDYRIALNQPFANGVKADTTGTVVINTVTKNSIRESRAVNILTNNLAVQGYFKYMLKDKESDVLPFEVGTYLGAKNVVNFGAGFYYHPNALGYFTQTNGVKALTKNDQLNIGADFYLDKGLPNKAAINFYAAYQYNNFGKNFIRNVGILNPSASLNSTVEKVSSASGGNAYPLLGTGSTVYAHAGYMFPSFKNGTAFMPYVAWTLNAFEAIKDVANKVDIGVNYFIAGHNAKITVQYSLRPTYYADAQNTYNYNNHKGELIIQAMVMF